MNINSKGDPNCKAEVIITEMPGNQLHITCSECSLSYYVPKM